MSYQFSLLHFMAVMMSCIITSTSLSQEHITYTPIPIQEAYKQKTRHSDGTPGEKYWQNSADYTIDVYFNPKTLIVKGTENITYYNNSPETLESILLMLFPDMYKQGNLRDFVTAGEDEHSGVIIHDIKINSTPINASRSNNKQMIYENTSAWVKLIDPLASGEKLDISISWEYALNAGSHMRTGQVDSSSFFIAYWFPRIAVYDDVDGWNNYTYTGVGEFYNDFGNYNVSITTPQDFLVWATGELQNPSSTFSDEILIKYKQAKKADSVVHIIASEDLLKPLTKKGSGMVTWEFNAENVCDFAFALSDHYLWDALSMNIGINRSPVFISTAFNPKSPDFHQVIAMAEKAMTYFSEEIPGLPFPYPSMTVFNGLDEMEYPMMVNDKSFEDLSESFKLTAHEICHSYFPFQTGCNERKYAWMDEGLTSFFEFNMIRDLVDTNINSVYFLNEYREMQGTERDIPLFTISEVVREPEYYAISYVKAVYFYSVLMDEIGKTRFKEILKEFLARWAGKHPTGHDFINTFSDRNDTDLGWLINPWMFEYGYVDQAIESVNTLDGVYKVHIKNIGNYPAPIYLSVNYEDGSSELIKEKPSVWSKGNIAHVIEIKTTKELQYLELYQDLPMDSNTKNNYYKP